MAEAELQGAEVLPFLEYRLDHSVKKPHFADLIAGALLAAAVHLTDNGADLGQFIAMHFRKMHAQKRGVVRQVEMHDGEVGVFSSDRLVKGQGCLIEGLPVALGKGIDHIMLGGGKADNPRLVGGKHLFLHVFRQKRGAFPLGLDCACKVSIPLLNGHENEGRGQDGDGKHHRKDGFGADIH